ncbi:MAG: hypothetical protein ABW318_02520 [Vicinamibacterales bacterium]
MTKTQSPALTAACRSHVTAYEWADGGMMARIVNSRCVLAVRALEVSTRYYKEVLGFSQDPIDADGWLSDARHVQGHAWRVRERETRERTRGSLVLRVLER